MRKGIEIKAVIVLFAWSVIFLHGVIPHSHHEDQSSTCHTLLHSDCTNQEEVNHASEVNGTGSHHEKICHFSSLLFNSFGYDDFIPTHQSDFKIVAAEEPENIFHNKTDRAESLFKTCTSQLRAPPAA